MKMLQNSNAAVSTGDAAGEAANASQGSGNYVTPTSIRATMTIVASLPIIMVYPFLQRYFVKGLTLGGVKG